MSEPMVVAHRGANVDLPEQSLAAYQRAAEVGADGVECDVRLTRDGHLVCHHDRTVDRTSDGRGAIADLTLAQLREFNFAATGPDPRQHHSIVIFDELLELLEQAPRPMRLLAEAKHPSRYGAQVEHRIHAALAEHPKVEATVMSFARAAVSRYRQLDESAELVWLFEYPMGAAPAAADVIGPRIDLVRSRPKIAERARASGMGLFVWTCNTPEDVRFVRDLGASAVVTDDPAMALRVLGREG